jgi:hypothetical protein
MPKGPRKFHFSFEKMGLTRFGGLSLFQSFCKSIDSSLSLRVTRSGVILSDEGSLKFIETHLQHL